MKLLSAQRVHAALAVFAVLALVAAVFWPALSGSFIFDDYPIFADNRAIEISDWSWRSWHGVWVWSHQNIQRPLAMFSYALNYVLGADTWGFKATNLAIHLFNTVLLFFLARKVLVSAWQPRDGDDAETHTQRIGIWALLLSTAWALHPLQISTVMYVVQRMELLGFTFTLLALLAYWHARQRQIAGLHAWLWLLVSAAMIAIGYCAKETAVLVPGYALLLELTVLRFRAGHRWLQRCWQTAYVLSCVTAGALLLFYLLPHYATTSGFSGRDFTAWERVLTQFRVVSMYIGWSVLPLPSQMHFYYDGYAASTGWLQPASTLAGGMFLLALLGLAVAIRKRRPLIALGIGWFFMANAITSAPIALELVFEHRNYPALFGILLAITDLIWLVTRRAHPRMPALLATIFILCLSLFTLLRASTWGDPLQLALTLAKDNPTSSRASYDLATRYMSMSEGDPASPMYSRTVRELERGAALPKSSPLPDQALLLMAAGGGVPLQKIWWDRFLHKLGTRPLGPQERNALTRLATVRIDDGNKNVDAFQLKKAYQIVLKRQPGVAQWRVQYADLASIALHDQTLAIEQLLMAVELKKSTPNYGQQLANYLLENHRAHEALAVIAKVQAMQLTSRNDPRLLEQKSQAMGMLQLPTDNRRD
jgi:hypothetical protein